MKISNNPVLSCSMEITTTNKTINSFSIIFKYLFNEHRKIARHIDIRKNKSKITFKLKDDYTADFERYSKKSIHLFHFLMDIIKNKFNIKIKNVIIKFTVLIGKNKMSPSIFIKNNSFSHLREIKTKLHILVKNFKCKNATPKEEYAYFEVFTYNLNNQEMKNILESEDKFIKRSPKGFFKITKTTSESYSSIKIQPTQTNSSLTFQVKSLITFLSDNDFLFNKKNKNKKSIYRIETVSYANSNKSSSIKLGIRDVNRIALSGSGLDLDYYS